MKRQCRIAQWFRRAAILAAYDSRMWRKRQQLAARQCKDASVKGQLPRSTNLSAVQPTQSCRELAAHQMKGGHHGYQLRKDLQPPRYAAVGADSGFEPGSQLRWRL